MACDDIEKLPPAPANDNLDRATLELRLTHISSTFSYEIPAAAVTHPAHHVATGRSDDQEIYHRFSPSRKRLIVAILCLLSFLGPMSSTSVLAAVPDVAAEYNTTGTIINLSNAFYMLMSSFGPCFTGPMSELYGRRWIYIACVTAFTLCSLGTSLSPTLSAYFVFRLATGLEGTGFLTLGAATIGDIYRPTERGTAMGWFLSGTLIGPAIGPFIGGLISNFTTWRAIFYLQTCLAAFGFVLVMLFLPETAHHKAIDDIKESDDSHTAHVLKMLNPLRPIALFRYPNLLAVGLASSALVWNIFGLTSPLLGGLFFLAPGVGYVMGTFIGGRYADYTVKKWIRKRGGVRKPQDRLRSCLVSLGVVIPICMIIYGWTVEKAVGGYPLPIIAMFIQGVGQLICFPSLNTYCIDVMEHRSSEVIGGNYLIRFFFAAIGTAVALPAVKVIGVGWFSTISAGFLLASAFMVWCTVQWSDEMQAWVEKDHGMGKEKKEKERRGKEKQRQGDLKEESGEEV